jgi:hypothetical protein
VTTGRRLARGYQAAAIVLLNSLLLLVVLDVVLAAVFRLKDRAGPTIDMYDRLDDATLARLFPDRGRAEIARTWVEGVQPLAYEPFTEFRERPRSGDRVTVDAAGFRAVRDQRPWPPDPRRFNVFVFGGSTTFGYGVTDADTVASQLQPLLARHGRDVAVYNFGRGYYYSTQERILYEQLLAAGFVPALAIFIDGLNDFCYDHDDSAVSPRLAASLEATDRPSLLAWLGGTALGRAAAFVQDAARERLAAPRPDAASRELGDDVMAHIIDRYLANKRLVEIASDGYHVTPLFVWQPVPMYKYERRFHLFADRGFFGVTRVRHGYEVMASRVQQHPLGDDFMWLADVQENATEPLYVDIVHYAPPFMARLASLIDERIGGLVERGR